MSAEKDLILKLIIQQLQYYDLDTLANAIQDSTGVNMAGLSASNDLASLVVAGQKALKGIVFRLYVHIAAASAPAPVEEEADAFLEFPEDSTKIAAAQKLSYNTVFVTTHKASCTCAAFNFDGRYAATGSVDNSLKVLDVDRLKISHGDEKPVIRTYYDHTAPVNDVVFHPNSRVLASCSDDCTIKLYDLQRYGIKRGFRYLQDAVPVKSLSFHPSGDFIVAGTTDNIIRMYDVNYLKCYSGLTGQNMHELGINQIRYHENGKVFSTAGEDGDVKIWDTVSGQCVKTLAAPHDGFPVVSASISHNGKYVLTAGEEGIPKLWDLTSGACLMTYVGSSARKTATKASFSWNEEYVISGDEKSKSVIVWCSRTGTLMDRLTGHTGGITLIASSPVEDMFISCSDDSRARFWAEDGIMENL